MLKSVFIFGLLYTQGAFAACKSNNCQRALYKNADQGNGFCHDYLSTPGMAIPDYLSSKCDNSPEKVSSACSCLGGTATVAPTSTAPTCDASCTGTVTATLTGTVTLPPATATVTVPVPVTIPGPPPPPVTVTVPVPVTIPGPPPPPVTVTEPGPPVTIPGPPPPPITVTEPAPPVTVTVPVPVTIPGPPVTVTEPGPPLPPVTVTMTQTTCTTPTPTACPVPWRPMCTVPNVASSASLFDVFYAGTCFTAAPGTETYHHIFYDDSLVTDCLAITACAAFAVMKKQKSFTMFNLPAQNAWECRTYNSVMTAADINTADMNVGRIYGLNLHI